MSANAEFVASLIRDVPDFPKPGVLFKDITPVIGDPEGLKASVEAMLAVAPPKLDVVCGIETRGFLFGGPIALELGIGFVPVRKPGKLPAAVYQESFDLEYGSSVLNIHQDALHEGQRVLLVDDLLATGGTLSAAAKLIDRFDADLAQVQVLVELCGLGGRENLAKVTSAPLNAVVTDNGGE